MIVPHPVPGRPRIAALDVVRGFALCGILLVNEWLWRWATWAQRPPLRR